MDLAERQNELFGDTHTPAGFAYRDELITPEEEQVLLQKIAALDFKPFDFHGYQGNRRVVSFGWRYDYDQRAVRPSDPLPAFLLPLRARAALFAGLSAESLQQALVTEYRPGAGIGWHRDKSMFSEVVAVSLRSACRLRFRYREGERWRRFAVTAQPRSAYLMSGAARQVWQHSIPALSELRYSVTFRNFVAGAAGTPAT